MIQKACVLALWGKERQLNIPLSSLNSEINDHRDLLLSIQKIKSDLGLDEYKGAIPGVRATATSVTRPDGFKIQQPRVLGRSDRGRHLPQARHLFAGGRWHRCPEKLDARSRVSLLSLMSRLYSCFQFFSLCRPM